MKKKKNLPTELTFSSSFFPRTLYFSFLFHLFSFCKGYFFGIHNRLGFQIFHNRSQFICLSAKQLNTCHNQQSTFQVCHNVPVGYSTVVEPEGGSRKCTPFVSNLWLNLSLISHQNSCKNMSACYLSCKNCKKKFLCSFHQSLDSPPPPPLKDSWIHPCSTNRWFHSEKHLVHCWRKQGAIS